MRAGLVLAGRMARNGLLPMLIPLASRAALVATAFAVSVCGAAVAAAQPTDYGSWPVDPNVITDSTAYAASAPVLHPDAQAGVSTVYTPRDGPRQITTPIADYANPSAAAAGLDASRAAAAAKIPGGRSEPAAVGTGGTILSGTSQGGAQSVSALTFQQGDTVTTVLFEGPPNDPPPTDLVVELGQKQDEAINAAQSP